MSAAGRLQGKSALVTGASAGIGRASALALAREGASVIATGRRQAELAALQSECEAGGGTLRYIVGDLADDAFVTRLAAEAADVDIFVNNAGLLTYAPFAEITPQQSQDMFQVNVLASIRMCQLMSAHMAVRGRGHIVLMSSLSYRNINRFAAVYGATKHAMAGIAKGLRIELGGTGIKITEVAPGMVDTDIRSGSTHPEVQKSIKARSYTPLSAQDVAEAVVFAVCTGPNCCPDLIELRPTYA
jgi:NADP-dependent 3-hydroxy acid dehydrogenase YdfG